MSKPLKIMVVDDDRQLCEAVAFEFEEDGHDVCQASGGFEAIEWLKKNDVDVILSDVKMPQGSGLDLLDFVKHRDVQHPPVVFFSGYSDVPREESFARGVERIFPKPFDVDELKKYLSSITQGFFDYWSQAKTMTPTAQIHEKFESLYLGDPQSKQQVGLGRGGLFLPLNNPKWVKDEILKITLSFQSGPLRDFECLARVEWKRNESDSKSLSGIGVSFINIEKAYLNQLADIPYSQIRAFIPLGKINS